MDLHSNLPERHVVSTATVARSERIDYWRDAVRADLLDLTFRVPSEVDFDASMVAMQVAPLSILTIRSSASTVERRRCGSTKGDDAIMFNFVFSGQILAQQDGRTTVVGAGDGVMCTGGRPYTLHLPENTHLACIRLAPDLLRRGVAAIDRATATSFSKGSELTPIVSSYAAHLLDTVAQLSAAGANTIARNFADLLLAMIGQVATGAGPALSEQGSVLLIRVKDHIERHLADGDLDAGRVAGAMRLSHRYINRLFEAEDTSLARYIWQRRLERAASDLQAPALRARGISQIALSNGFNDMSHFSKAFRLRYGTSARDFRRSSKQSSPGC